MVSIDTLATGFSPDFADTSKKAVFGNIDKRQFCQVDEMRKPASSTEYREISNHMRAHHETEPKEETGTGKSITKMGGLTTELDLGDKHTVGCVFT